MDLQKRREMYRSACFGDLDELAWNKMTYENYN